MGWTCIQISGRSTSQLSGQERKIEWGWNARNAYQLALNRKCWRVKVLETLKKENVFKDHIPRDIEKSITLVERKELRFTFLLMSARSKFLHRLKYVACLQTGWRWNRVDRQCLWRWKPAWSRKRSLKCGTYCYQNIQELFRNEGFQLNWRESTMKVKIVRERVNFWTIHCMGLKTVLLLQRRSKKCGDREQQLWKGKVRARKILLGGHWNGSGWLLMILLKDEDFRYTKNGEIPTAFGILNSEVEVGLILNKR